MGLCVYYPNFHLILTSVPTLSLIIVEVPCKLSRSITSLVGLGVNSLNYKKNVRNNVEILTRSAHYHGENL